MRQQVSRLKLGLSLVADTFKQAKLEYDGKKVNVFVAENDAEGKEVSFWDKGELKETCIGEEAIKTYPAGPRHKITEVNAFVFQNEWDRLAYMQAKNLKEKKADQLHVVTNGLIAEAAAFILQEDRVKTVYNYLNFDEGDQQGHAFTLSMEEAGIYCPSLNHVYGEKSLSEALADDYMGVGRKLGPVEPKVYHEPTAQNVYKAAPKL